MNSPTAGLLPAELDIIKGFAEVTADQQQLINTVLLCLHDDLLAIGIKLCTEQINASIKPASRVSRHDAPGSVF